MEGAKSLFLHMSRHMEHFFICTGQDSTYKLEWDVGMTCFIGLEDVLNNEQKEAHNVLHSWHEVIIPPWAFHPIHAWTNTGSILLKNGGSIIAYARNRSLLPTSLINKMSSTWKPQSSKLQVLLSITLTASVMELWPNYWKLPLQPYLYLEEVTAMLNLPTSRLLDHMSDFCKGGHQGCVMDVFAKQTMNQ